ncbi:MAG: hypothetical protein KME29_31355 [Calothrix sp. FI2-JRJ7]|jgi:rRNA-processing protein FCF1|nr:hypothetical protein [Calothrix sp. FI2-JRJ7]
MVEPTRRYKGKKVTAIVPLTTYEEIEKIATEDKKSIASTLVALAIEGLKYRKNQN